MRQLSVPSRFGPGVFSIACIAVGLPLGTSCTGAVGQHEQDEPHSGGGSEPVSGSGSTSPPNVSGAPSTCAAIPKRLWKLTPDQYDATIAALIPKASLQLGVAQAATLARSTSFAPEASRLDISTPHAEALLSSADAVVAQALRDPGKLHPCLASSGGRADPDCIRSFMEAFGMKAFRRPLGQDELSEYVAFFESEAKEGGGDVALDQLLHALFMSPHFLFRTELGSPGGAKEGRMTSFERASALSYLFLDGPPDDELMLAAINNELDTPQQVEAHVRRLIATPEAAGLRKFFSLAYGFAGVRSAAKNERTFPDWSSEVAEDFVRESEAFVQDVLSSDAPTLTTLLTANHSMLNERLVQRILNSFRV